LFIVILELNTIPNNNQKGFIFILSDSKRKQSHINLDMSQTILLPSQPPLPELPGILMNPAREGILPSCDSTACPKEIFFQN
jgi:hypothetical protein